MTERPILFNAPMVRAVLREVDPKTMTRRVVRKQFAPDAVVAEVCATTAEGWQTVGHSGLWWDDAGACIDDAVRCPYGVPGDRLWVRETWQAVNGNDRARHIVTHPRPDRGWLEYAATPRIDEPAYKWRPSIHMPRWASRITLEVTGVRVERLQDITNADAIREGTTPCYVGPHPAARHKAGFGVLWDQINGPGSWEANPWVWVVEFERITP